MPSEDPISVSIRWNSEVMDCCQVMDAVSVDPEVQTYQYTLRSCSGLQRAPSLLTLNFDCNTRRGTVLEVVFKDGATSETTSTSIVLGERRSSSKVKEERCIAFGSALTISYNGLTNGAMNFTVELYSTDINLSRFSLDINDSNEESESRNRNNDSPEGSDLSVDLNQLKIELQDEEYLSVVNNQVEVEECSPNSNQVEYSPQYSDSNDDYQNCLSDRQYSDLDAALIPQTPFNIETDNQGRGNNNPDQSGINDRPIARSQPNTNNRPINNSRPIANNGQISNHQPPIINNRQITDNRPINSNPLTTHNRQINNNQPLNTNNRWINSNQPITNNRPINHNRQITDNRQVNNNRKITDNRPTNNNPQITDNRPINNNQANSSNRAFNNNRPITNNRPSNNIRPFTSSQPYMVNHQISNNPNIVNHPIIDNPPIIDIHPIIDNYPMMNNQPIIDNYQIINGLDNHPIINQPIIDNPPTINNHPIIIDHFPLPIQQSHVPVPQVVFTYLPDGQNNPPHDNLSSNPNIPIINNFSLDNLNQFKNCGVPVVLNQNINLYLGPNPQSKSHRSREARHNRTDSPDVTSTDRVDSSNLESGDQSPNQIKRQRQCETNTPNMISCQTQTDNSTNREGLPIGRTSHSVQTSSQDLLMSCERPGPSNAGHSQGRAEIPKHKPPALIKSDDNPSQESTDNTPIEVSKIANQILLNVSTQQEPASKAPPQVMSIEQNERLINSQTKLSQPNVALQLDSGIVHTPQAISTEKNKESTSRELLHFQREQTHPKFPTIQDLRNVCIPEVKFSEKHEQSTSQELSAESLKEQPQPKFPIIKDPENTHIPEVKFTEKDVQSTLQGISMNSQTQQTHPKFLTKQDPNNAHIPEVKFTEKKVQSTSQGISMNSQTEQFHPKIPTKQDPNNAHFPTVISTERNEQTTLREISTDSQTEQFNLKFPVKQDPRNANIPQVPTKEENGQSTSQGVSMVSQTEQSHPKFPIKRDTKEAHFLEVPPTGGNEESNSQAISTEHQSQQMPHNEHTHPVTSTVTQNGGNTSYKQLKDVNTSSADCKPVDNQINQEVNEVNIGSEGQESPIQVEQVPAYEPKPSTSSGNLNNYSALKHLDLNRSIERINTSNRSQHNLEYDQRQAKMFHFIPNGPTTHSNINTSNDHILDLTCKKNDASTSSQQEISPSPREYQLPHLDLKHKEEQMAMHNGTSAAHQSSNKEQTYDKKDTTATTPKQPNPVNSVGAPVQIPNQKPVATNAPKGKRTKAQCQNEKIREDLLRLNEQLMNFEQLRRLVCIPPDFLAMNQVRKTETQSNDAAALSRNFPIPNYTNIIKQERVIEAVPLYNRGRPGEAYNRETSVSAQWSGPNVSALLNPSNVSRPFNFYSDCTPRYFNNTANNNQPSFANEVANTERKQGPNREPPPKQQYFHDRQNENTMPQYRQNQTPVRPLPPMNYSLENREMSNSQATASNRHNLMRNQPQQAAAIKQELTSIDDHRGRFNSQETPPSRLQDLTKQKPQPEIKSTPSYPLHNFRPPVLTPAVGVPNMRLPQPPSDPRIRTMPPPQQFPYYPPQPNNPIKQELAVQNEPNPLSYQGHHRFYENPNGKRMRVTSTVFPSVEGPSSSQPPPPEVNQKRVKNKNSPAYKLHFTALNQPERGQGSKTNDPSNPLRWNPYFIPDRRIENKPPERSPQITPTNVAKPIKQLNKEVAKESGNNQNNTSKPSPAPRSLALAGCSKSDNSNDKDLTLNSKNKQRQENSSSSSSNNSTSTNTGATSSQTTTCKKDNRESNSGNREVHSHGSRNSLPTPEPKTVSVGKIIKKLFHNKNKMHSLNKLKEQQKANKRKKLNSDSTLTHDHDYGSNKKSSSTKKGADATTSDRKTDMTHRRKLPSGKGSNSSNEHHTDKPGSSGTKNESRNNKSKPRRPECDKSASSSTTEDEEQQTSSPCQGTEDSEAEEPVLPPDLRPNSLLAEKFYNLKNLPKKKNRSEPPPKKPK